MDATINLSGGFESVENKQMVATGRDYDSDSDDWTMVDLIDRKSEERQYPWQKVDDHRPPIHVEATTCSSSLCPNKFEVEILQAELKMRNLGFKTQKGTIKMHDDYIETLKNDLKTLASTIQSKCEIIENQNLTIESQRGVLNFKDELIRHNNQVIAALRKDKYEGILVPDEKPRKPHQEVHPPVQNLMKEMDQKFNRRAFPAPKALSTELTTLTADLRSIVNYMQLKTQHLLSPSLDPGQSTWSVTKRP